MGKVSTFSSSRATYNTSGVRGGDGAGTGGGSSSASANWSAAANPSMDFSSYLNQAKDWANFNQGMTFADRANAFGYRSAEIGQRGDIEKSLEGMRQGGETQRTGMQIQGSQDLENIRQDATTSRLIKEIANRENMQQADFGFALKKQGQERQAAVNAFRGFV